MYHVFVLIWKINQSVNLCNNFSHNLYILSLTNIVPVIYFLIYFPLMKYGHQHSRFRFQHINVSYFKEICDSTIAN